jgi:hypothetical protein
MEGEAEKLRQLRAKVGCAAAQFAAKRKVR